MFWAEHTNMTPRNAYPITNNRQPLGLDMWFKIKILNTITLHVHYLDMQVPLI